MVAELANNDFSHDPAWIEIQTKLAFQEDSVLKLNDVVAEQQQDIMKLQGQMKQLIKELGSVLGNLDEGSSSQGAAIDQKPPHY